MRTTGIYLETREGEVKQTARELATLARQAGRKGVGVLFGDEPGPAAESLGPFGIEEILHVSGAGTADYHPALRAEQLARVIRAEGFADFLACDSAQGKDLLPRVAARLDAPLAADCVAIDLEGGEALKPLYSGKVNARIRLDGDVRLYALRPNVVRPEAGKGEAAAVREIEAEDSSTQIEIREVAESVCRAVDLTEAQVIVAGGYGVGKAENFEVLEELADRLGGAVAASRRAVDEGMAPYHMQVGQTGKVVNPQLYIACGISGAVQHFAGMKSSRVIVAINKDPEAPIFQMAHYGIVGDLFEVVPRLTAAFDEALEN